MIDMNNYSKNVALFLHFYTLGRYHYRKNKHLKGRAIKSKYWFHRDVLLSRARDIPLDKIAKKYRTSRQRIRLVENKLNHEMVLFFYRIQSPELLDERGRIVNYSKVIPNR